MARAIGSVIVMAALACAGYAVTGCNSTMQTMTAAGTLSPALSSDPAITAADIALLRAMSRAQQLAHLAVGDSMEIAMARVAVRRTRNGAIADFARRLIDDHGESLKRSDMMARHDNVALKTAPKDTMPAHLAKMLEALDTGTPTVEFNGTYMLSQIQLHEHALDELQALQGIVTDEALRQHVEANIPMIQAHLASARHIAAQLGYTMAR